MEVRSVTGPAAGSADTALPAADAPAPVVPSRLPGALVVTTVIAGAALRIAILATSLGRPDADEVISGLMARHIGTDGFPLFVWGQHYGGTVELVPVWLTTTILGSSVIALRIPNLWLAAANCVLLWRLARRFVPAMQAALAGCLMWVGPPVAVWFGLREQLFYPPTVTFGLLLGLLALQLRDRPTSPRWLLLGLVGGLGWWTSPSIVYLAVPAVVVLFHPYPFARRAPSVALGLAAVVVGALVGASPWIADSLAHDFATIRSPKAFPVTGSYLDRFLHFFTTGLPGVLGLREIFTYRWIGGLLGVAAYLALMAVLGRRIAHTGRALPWDVVGFAAYPFLFALVPMALDDPNMRYLFFVIPFLAVLVARSATSIRGAAIALALTTLVSGVGLVRLHTVSEVERSGFRVGNVGDLGDAIRVLDDEGITDVYASYWVAYRIDFETRERIVAASTSGVDRHHQYNDEVRAAPRAAWVVQPGDEAAALTTALNAMGVGHHDATAGEFVVVVPDRNVAPERLQP